MSVAYPEGSLSTLESDPTGDPSASLESASFATMAALASAYQLAQYRLSANAERASGRLWLGQRPITDSGLTAWMQSWDSLLAGQAQQQAALTTAYVNTMMSQFGVRIRPVPLIGGMPDTATEWLNSAYGRLAPASLRSEVARAQEAAQIGRATIAQAARLDRIPWLHSPVIKNRWHLSQGIGASESAIGVGPFTQGAAYDAGRAVERMMMSAYDWPTFKNGTAMAYMRVPQAGACGWCRLVATRLYSLKSFKSGAAWHVRCRCSWVAVPYASARAYADTFASTNGDYYAAAAHIGTWSGPAPKSYRDVLAERAARSDSTTPFTQAEKEALAAQRAAAAGRGRSTTRQGQQRAATTAVQVSAAREEQAVALVTQANEINAQARSAFASGNAQEAKRLYQQAAQLTSQALRLRTST